jgi:hypothetical protein
MAVEVRSDYAEIEDDDVFKTKRSVSFGSALCVPPEPTALLATPEWASPDRKCKDCLSELGMRRAVSNPERAGDQHQMSAIDSSLSTPSTTDGTHTSMPRMIYFSFPVFEGESGEDDIGVDTHPRPRRGQSGKAA